MLLSDYVIASNLLSANKASHFGTLHVDGIGRGYKAVNSGFKYNAVCMTSFFSLHPKILNQQVLA